MKRGSVSGSKTDNIPLAAATVLFTVLALSLGDALIKLISSDFVIWQIFVLRSVIAIPILVVFLAIGASLKRPAALGWTAVRSLLLVMMWVAYYAALPHLQLSVAAAAYYTLPIFITLFSAALIGERIRWTGWIAVFVGFMGVLLILRPQAGDFNWFALLPLVAAILYALAMILTRSKCRAEHPLMLSLALNIAFVIIGGIATVFVEVFADLARVGFLTAPWVAMGSSQWLAMVLLAVAILIGSIGAAFAYQRGPASIIGTFDFAYVGFAVLWGVVFFAEVPDAVSVTGMVLIVAAGLMSLRK